VTPQRSKEQALRLAALVIAGVVAVRETLYYLEHTHRPGPAVVIGLLAFAVALLAIADLRKGGAA